MKHPLRFERDNICERCSFSTSRSTSLLPPLIEKDRVGLSNVRTRAFVLTLMLWLAPVGTGSALIGGEVDNDELYAAVVLLNAGPRDLCSATKINTHQFLTAAHCVIDGTSATLKAAFKAGGRIAVSHTGAPHGSKDFTQLEVQDTLLPPTYLKALRRFAAYKAERIAALSKIFSGDQLKLREHAIQIRHQFSARFPDLAIIRVRTSTEQIPILPLDLEPVQRGDPVILVGFGCEHSPHYNRPSSVYGRRTWGRTEVIRADTVNFYSFARLMRADHPSLCPGDSGGPVMRNGRVVGVNGTVYGLGPADAARSNMSVNLSNLPKEVKNIEAITVGQTMSKIDE